MENLWPTDLGSVKMNLPKDILLEQARYLNTMTKNVLIADIKTSSSTTTYRSGKKEDFIVHRLIITAPLMGNYQFDLLRIEHPLSVYPLNFISSFNDTYFTISTEEEFLRVLGELLSTEKLKNALNLMIAQSKSVL